MDESNKKKRKVGMAALQTVLKYDEGERIKILERENAQLKKRFEMLELIQIKKAATNDIFTYFDRINDPEDPTTIGTLKEIRDFIVENCVQIQLPNLMAGDPCTFCTVGGHHPFLSSVLKACQHFDIAVERHHGEISIQPDEWQWTRDKEPAMLCHQECLATAHMHVEPKRTRITRYLNTEGFPFQWISQAIHRQEQGQSTIDVLGGRTGNMWDMQYR